MGLSPANLHWEPRGRRQRVRLPVPGGTVTMTTTEGVGVQIPGPPRDLVVLESDDPIPVTIYSIAENLQGDQRPVSSTELRIEWRIGSALFVEQWHPVDCTRNLVCNSVRVSAVYRDAGYTSPRSTTDRVTAWAAPGHAEHPRAAKLWQFPTEVGDPLNGLESFIVPPFASKFVLLAADWMANSFFSAPGAYLQFTEGSGQFLVSESRSWRLDDGWLPNAFYESLELPPGARSMIWQSGGAAWLGDADWLAIKFLCEV